MSDPALELRAEIAGISLIRELGLGPQGTVYLGRAPARWDFGEREVAVKVIAAPCSDADFERVVDELAAHARADHSLVARIFEVGRTDDGAVYYAREYSPHGQRGSADEVLGTATVLHAMACAARGAHALHEVGVAHRAIKPGNVLVFDEGPKLADIDVRHLLAPGQTVTGHSSGLAVQCLAPELLRGEQASRASDVWALGVTLHAALTGRGIYAGAEDPAQGALTVMRAIVAGAPPEIDTSLPAPIAHLIEECVTQDPIARPATARVVAERIDSLEQAR
ncbi:MAG: hypothetical protein NVSMB25_10740 [Thermoleophilaceae bacterium]